MNWIHRLFMRFPAWILPGVVVVAILYLTLMRDPLPDMDMPAIPGLDKIVHAIMFGGLSWTVVLDIAWRRAPRCRHMSLVAAAVAAAVASALFGGIIELLQGAMQAGRSADVWDFVADTAGACLGSAIALAMTARNHHHTHKLRNGSEKDTDAHSRR